MMTGAGVWRSHGYEYDGSRYGSALEFQQLDFSSVWIVGWLLVSTEMVI